MHTKITRTDRFISFSVLRFLPDWVRPNHITFLRLLGVPLIIWFLMTNQYLVGLIFFISFSFTDAMDGALARTKNQITDFGKYFDPFADKILIGVVVLIMSSRFLNIYIGMTIIFIEILFIFSATIERFSKNNIIQANGWGKIKMILQTLGILFLFLYPVLQFPILLLVSEFILYMAIFFALISLLVYRGI